ncbi:MAG: hypothetical protein AAF503_04455 [Pseudomonadota bacterium]
MFRRLTLIGLLSGVPVTALSDDADRRLRQAETSADRARMSVTPDQRNRAIERTRRDLRDINAVDRPFVGRGDTVNQNRIDRIERKIDRPATGTSDRPYSNSRNRSSVLPLGPREVTLDPSILDD